MKTIVAFVICALVVLLSQVQIASAAPPEGTLRPVITSVSNYTPDFRDGSDIERIYRTLLASIPSPAISDFFTFDQSISHLPLILQYKPLTTNIAGQSPIRTYAYRAFWFYHEYWIGTNKNNGFFLFSTSITIVSATLTEEEVFNISDLYKQSFTCVFKSQNGAYDDVKQNLTLTPCNDSTLIPVIFELSATNCYFTWKQAGKNFAYGDKLYTVSDSNFSTRFPADLYQLKENTWPSIFALYVRYAAGWSTQNVQFFTVDGRRILPRMWYRTSASDIAWPASSVTLDGGLTTNIFPLTDTDGGGQFDFSEYFYKRDPLDAQDDDPNYTQANPDIIAIAIDNGYVSIDDEVTELPTTGDVNIEVDVQGRLDSVTSKLDSRLQSIAPYQAALNILRGVTNRETRASPELPKFAFTLPMFGIFGEYDSSYADLALDFNEIRQNTDIWPIFLFARVLVGLFIVITQFFTCFKMLYDTLKD